jgi:hypothetical protein
LMQVSNDCGGWMVVLCLGDPISQKQARHNHIPMVVSMGIVEDLPMPLPLLVRRAMLLSLQPQSDQQQAGNLESASTWVKPRAITTMMSMMSTAHDLIEIRLQTLLAGYGTRLWGYK